MPTNSNYIKWQAWSERTLGKLRELGKEQHTRQRKLVLKARKGFAHKLENKENWASQNDT